MSLFETTGLHGALADLKKDLLGEDGPQISTMRNHQLAILVYAPEDEFLQREAVGSLIHDLTEGDWEVETLDLQKLLFARLRARSPRYLDRLVQQEKMLAEDDRARALEALRQKLSPHLEGADGLAADVSREIGRIKGEAKHPDKVLVFLGRVGALYPFFRSSALLKYLDGHTHGVPVVLLYPGRKVGDFGLSFMGVLKPDGDYRPRIYSYK